MSSATHKKPRWIDIAEKLGFNPGVLVFALRTALAGFVALAVAYAMGLEHPHWAAMSAWASSQPMREQLLSRGLYRLGGSVVGVVFAVALVLVAQDSIWVLALGLAFWSALCAFLGNLQRGYMVYGCMLAGYSAAMVVLLHHGPTENIWPFAWDRLLTVVTGVVVALAVAWCFAPRRKASILVAQSRAALAQVLNAAIHRLQQSGNDVKLDTLPLLSQLAQVEELLELYPEGSRTARNTSRVMHWQQHQALELVYQLNMVDRIEAAQKQTSEQMALCEALQQVVELLQLSASQTSAMTSSLHTALRKAIHACETLAELAAQATSKQDACLQALFLLLQAMYKAVQAEQNDIASTESAKKQESAYWRAPQVVLHRDWVGAKEAAVRAGGTVLVVGILWAITGWSLIAFAMLGLSVMLLVFSAFENPQRTMAFVLRGQIIGAVLALLCQWLVWPHAQSGWQMVWMLLPFLLVGGLVFAHKRTAAGAMDTNMAMLILLAPVFPFVADMPKHIGYALAVVSGPALAWVVYRCVYPTNALRRMRTLAFMMINEVPKRASHMLGEAGSKWTVPDGEGQWQAQLHHRLLKLVRWADKTQHPRRQELPELGRALRAMQSTLEAFQTWRLETVGLTAALRRADRCLELALRRTTQWGASQDLGMTKQAASTDKAIAAWQQLSQQPSLSHELQVQAARIASTCLPELQKARSSLQ